MTLLLWAVLPNAVLAGVNLRNGNFYVTYTDMIVGKSELKINRTYNSKAPGTLMFGVGWGSPFETRLEIAGDGTVIVEENGFGLRREYRPPHLSTADLGRLLDRMMHALEAHGWLASDKMREDTRRQLARDSELRQSMQRRLVSEGLVAATEIPPGEQLRSAQFQGTVITREPGGYYRRSNDGYERFSHDGKLIESDLDDESSFRLRHDADGHLRQFITEEGEVIEVQTDDAGLVTRLDFGDEYATYTYDSKNRLIEARNDSGTVFGYEYDDQNNMTAVLYENGDRLRIEYDDQGMVASVIQRDGETTRYAYGDLPATDPDVHDSYFTHVRMFDSPESDIPWRDERQEYEIRIDRFGRSYTARHLIRRDGQERETRKNSCGFPTLQRMGSKKAEYDYDDDCHLIMKRQDGREIRLTYDPRSGKIASVTERDLERDTEVASYFTYDHRARLLTARNSRGESVNISYNAENMIDTMTDAQGQVMRFEYNAIGKPVVIEIIGLGRIDITYDDQGEISDTKSDAGGLMARQVTRTFQGLLTLVKPAGVSFNL